MRQLHSIKAEVTRKQKELLKKLNIEMQISLLTHLKCLILLTFQIE